MIDHTGAVRARQVVGTWATCERRISGAGSEGLQDWNGPNMTLAVFLAKLWCATASRPFRQALPPSALCKAPRLWQRQRAPATRSRTCHRSGVLELPQPDCGRGVARCILGIGGVGGVAGVVLRSLGRPPATPSGAGARPPDVARCRNAALLQGWKALRDREEAFRPAPAARPQTRRSSRVNGIRGRWSGWRRWACWPTGSRGTMQRCSVQNPLAAQRLAKSRVGRARPRFDRADCAAHLCLQYVQCRQGPLGGRSAAGRKNRAPPCGRLARERAYRCRAPPGE